MSETEVKTNPQGDPITSVAAPTSVAKKDPHAEAKRQKIVTPEYMFLEAPRTKEFITGSEAAKEAIRRGVELSLDEGIAVERRAIARAMRSADARGAMAAYLRGEPYEFKGQ